MLGDPLRPSAREIAEKRVEILARLRRLNLRHRESRIAGDMSDAIYYGAKIDEYHRMLAEIEAAAKEGNS